MLLCGYWHRLPSWLAWPNSQTCLIRHPSTFIWGVEFDKRCLEDVYKKWRYDCNRPGLSTPMYLDMLITPPLAVDYIVVIVVLLWLVYLVYRRIRANAVLPPGPVGYPIIGNVLDMMVNEIWVAAQEWGKRYGTWLHYSFWRLFSKASHHKVDYYTLEDSASPSS